MCIRDSIYDDPEMSLDLYTRQCSLGVTAEQLAISAATIADDGVNPLTKRRAFGAELTPKVVALMSAVGFYEHSGDWLYATGPVSYTHLDVYKRQALFR